MYGPLPYCYSSYEPAENISQLRHRCNIFFWKYSMTMRPLIVCRAFAILGISVMFLNSKKEVTIGPRETSMIELIANIVNS